MAAGDPRADSIRYDVHRRFLSWAVAEMLEPWGFLLMESAA
jgi:hypothetical protein